MRPYIIAGELDSVQSCRTGFLGKFAGRVSSASFVEVARNALASVCNIFFWDDAILNIVPVATIYIDLDPVLDIVIFFKFIRMDAEVVDLVAIILVGINLTILSAFIGLTIWCYRNIKASVLHSHRHLSQKIVVPNISECPNYFK